MTLHTILVAVAVWALQGTAARSADCRDWRQCQQLAAQAYDLRDYETFHDLAWRAMQTGPSHDPALMYLLARAQSLSGRPHDSLVMLDRLLELGFVADAATNDDFRAVRQLREWPEMESRLSAAASQPAASTSPLARVAPPPVAAGDSLPAEDVLRVAAGAVRSVGLAYDRVSSRFVVADARQRKLVIIDERSRRVMDLVTARSAGFFDITGFDVDPARGDLWVVSAEPADASGERAATALHKLQLVSGRPLERVPVPDSQQPCRLADVAIAPGGTVFVLDTVGRRVLRFHQATHTFATAAALRLTGVTSVAPVSDRLVYVAHASGIVRVDTLKGAAVPVSAARGLQLAGLERIRWMRDSLLGVQRLSDGSRHAVRIRIVDGRAASIDVMDRGMQLDGGGAATVSGDEFFFVVRPGGADGDEIVIRRSRIR